jgi:1-deoxy-D-xylulose-5-phosphate reductoisomerase
VVKRLGILGSTGSIGRSTLDIVESFPERFGVAVLAAGSNIELLEQQVERFGPECVAVGDEDAGRELSRRLGSRARVVRGPDGLVEAATHDGIDLLVSALVGAVGLPPTYAAVCEGRDVALANKETLVVAGEYIVGAAAASGSRILPVDSEHNAVHQCLRGEKPEEVLRVWLTASGGPFRQRSLGELERVTPDDALRHPTWKMGPKITVDSATLMNKGLEVIEARWLFDVGPDRIRVVVHPQSVVHSMIELIDGSFKAQLGVTDMRHPIQYALSWPRRWQTKLRPFDPVGAGPLEFEEPDLERFPCLGLAYRALRSGGAAPAVLNAANEVAASAFLAGRIRYLDIASIVAATLERHGAERAASLEDLLAADARARRTAEGRIDAGPVR